VQQLYRHWLQLTQLCFEQHSLRQAEQVSQLFLLLLTFSFKLLLFFFFFSCSLFMWSLAWIAFDLAVASLMVMLLLSLDCGTGLTKFSLSSLSSSSSSLSFVSGGAQAFVFGSPSGSCCYFSHLTFCDRLWCLVFEICPCVAILLCARLSD
jgi:hypothetical protein